MSYWSDDDEDWGSPTLQQKQQKQLRKAATVMMKTSMNINPQIP